MVMMTDKLHYVYHIKLPGMGLDEGYVGVTDRPSLRFLEHKKSKLNPHLTRALRKYADEIVYVILDSFDSRSDAHWLEFTLRPFRNIGWNIAVGGLTPPKWSGKRHSEDTKMKMSEKAKGRIITEQQRVVISQKLSGVKFSKERVARMKPPKGLAHHKAKACNIYDHSTDEVVAYNVTVNGWAKENGVQQSALSLTARADRSKPSSRNNRLHTKGVYAGFV